MIDSTSFKDIEKPILLQFSAEWCGPCKLLAPIVDQVAAKIHELADVRRVDVDSESELSIAFHVRGVPTLVLLDKGGAIFWRHTGLISEKELLKQVDRLQQR